MVVCACAAEHCQLAVLAVEFAEQSADFLFRHGVGKVIFIFVDNIFRNVGIEVVKRVDTDALEHFLNVAVGMWKICKAHNRWIIGFLRSKRHIVPHSSVIPVLKGRKVSP